MFLEKYLSEFNYNLIIDTYDELFLRTLEEDRFLEIYGLFKYYKFYFIDDIVLKYLEIFTMDFEDVNKGILNLKSMLGDNFVYIIGNDMSYLNKILDIEG